MPSRPTGPLVIVHAGYHKTGTTSLQNFMNRNKETLRPYCSYYGKADFLSAGANARIYAQRPFPWRLYRFRRSFRRFLAQIDPDPVIVLSRETFAGNMPGHRKWHGGLVKSYGPPSAALARVIIQELLRRFGPETRITYLMTTRDKEPWIKSVYGHLLRSRRLVDDFDTFRTSLKNLQSPAKQAQVLARKIAPVELISVALEDYGTHRFGPAEALLQLISLPDDIRETLQPIHRPANTGQSADLQQQFLQLNRQIKDKAELKRRKERILKSPTPRH
ncbi:hypothetical protein GCM10007939_21630 [Amylibacter marinus]|uniref:Sulfotransferase family protein n=1 Tax=Amylibacter marinus TaxID=1475483 RepID=A0ABQ5VXE2_9RHOB|nr:hypothetical protein [Amylibacter marinus]GLQ35879.1 hypothetical protein GCM10007939_21630 [Amylibacter marinus]